MLLNITIEGCDMVMELQLHLKDGESGIDTPCKPSICVVSCPVSPSSHDLYHNTNHSQ